MSARRWLEDKKDGGLLPYVVVCQGKLAVLQLLVAKDEALLTLGKPFLNLDLGLHLVNGIQAVNLESDGPALLASPSRRSASFLGDQAWIRARCCSRPA